MVKYFRLISKTALLVLGAFYYPQNTAAAEPEKINVAKLNIIRPDSTQIDFSKIAVLVTSSYESFGQTAEDWLSAKLKGMGFQVVEGTEITEATIQELGKLEKTAEMGEVKQQTKEDEKQPKDIFSIIKIGRKLNLSAIILGTLFEGRCQISFADEKKPPRLMEKTVVSTFFIQILDIHAKKVALSAMLEYDKGESISKAIDDIVSLVLIKEAEMRR